MIRQKFEPDVNIDSLSSYNSVTFGPITSKLNVHVICTSPTGPGMLTLMTSIDGINWDVSRDTSGVGLPQIMLDDSKISQFEVFGRLFMLKGTSDGQGGTLDKILIYHD